MNWKRVCAASDVPENTLKRFDIDGIAIVIANYGAGFQGFPPYCPHMEEPLADSGMLDGGILTCSKHLWQWDLRTGEKVGLAEKPLLCYDIKTEGDDVMADLEIELINEYDVEDDMDDDDFFGSD
ncbi:MAG: Rieske 2Fe-2S domain-containing protein [Rhodospirillales bacterium]|nr:Rieske 2Fe-2S domain-containing protein [Rhodospirillales bacterium]